MNSKRKYMLGKVIGRLGKIGSAGCSGRIVARVDLSKCCSQIKFLDSGVCFFSRRKNVGCFDPRIVDFGFLICTRSWAQGAQSNWRMIPAAGTREEAASQGVDVFFLLFLFAHTITLMSSEYVDELQYGLSMWLGRDNRLWFTHLYRLLIMFGLHCLRRFLRAELNWNYSGSLLPLLCSSNALRRLRLLLLRHLAVSWVWLGIEFETKKSGIKPILCGEPGNFCSAWIGM